MGKAKLTDLRPDASNANRGTERGRYALETSLRKYGAGRSILLDRHGHIIAGNKTAETAADVGIDDVIIVQTDGRQLVAVQRTDLDIDSPEGRGLAYADNRVGQLDLDWDVDRILSDLQTGVDFSGLWSDYELEKLTGQVGEIVDQSNEWVGMPEFENEDAFGAIATVKVHIGSEADLAKFAQLMGQTVTVDTKWIWFPKHENENLKAFRCIDES